MGALKGIVVSDHETAAEEVASIVSIDEMSHALYPHDLLTRKTGLDNLQGSHRKQGYHQPVC